MSLPQRLSAFAGYGIEIEYMIVDGSHLDVRPFSDRLLCAGAGFPTSDVARGAMGWSNELAMHVFEVKNREPAPSLQPLAEAFHAEVLEADRLLADFGARLMPGGMHPWMDPATETRLWTLDHASLYACYDRIFDCRRHGWGNMQSIHVNLPFADDVEFARLHSAARLALPILPALAASSPWADKRPAGAMDHRLVMYRDHQRRVPTSMGQVIPETCASPAEYQTQVLAPMYREVGEYGAVRCKGDAGELQHEWLNARGAIPRFERSAIEIRVLDTQECPLADIAVAAATAALVRQLYDGPCAEGLCGPDTADLVTIFDACIEHADEARIEDACYLELLGLDSRPRKASELWKTLVERLSGDGLLDSQWLAPLQLILEQGPLARRLERALDTDPGRLRDVYHELCECLHDNRQYRTRR